MPIYYPNIKFSDCWGSVGSITFYHKEGKCYFRKKSKCTFPGTPCQLKNAEIHHRAILAWQSLEHATQMGWRRFAIDVPAHRPPFDNKNHISGYNLFVSAYHGFAQLGNEHIPSPTPYPEFPTYSLKVVSSFAVGNDLEIKCQVCGVPERFKILGKIMLAKPGYGCNTGKLRNFVAKEAELEASDPRIITFSIPNFKSLYGLDLNDYQLHIRHILLDTISGYRNNYNKLSVKILI